MSARMLLAWAGVLGVTIVLVAGSGTVSGQVGGSGMPARDAVPATAGMNDFAPVVDTQIFSGSPHSAYSVITTMGVGADEDLDVYRTLLRFDLTSLPPGVEIQSAYLYLYVVIAQGGSDSIIMRRIIQSWSAMVTWSSRPATSEPSASTWVDMWPNMWRSWNATELVRGWYAGTYPNYGMMLVSHDESSDFLRVFSSAEGAHDPYLRVTYSYPTATSTPKPTRTPTRTRRPTSTSTRTPTITRTPTATRTATATFTQRPTNTPASSPTWEPGAVPMAFFPVLMQ